MKSLFREQSHWIKIVLLGFGLLVGIHSGAQEQKPPPPCSTELHRQFDFWIGTWEVHDVKTGSLEGIDVVKKDFNDCGFTEHWQQQNDRHMLPGATERFFGKSLNYFSQGEWFHQWVDNMGGHAELHGKWENGMMTMAGKLSGENWSFPYRVVWQPMPNGTIYTWGEGQLGNATRDGKPAVLENTPSGKWVRLFYDIHHPKK